MNNSPSLPENCTSYTIILPARNEAESLVTLLPTLRKAHPTAEIILVNDASTDETIQLAAVHNIRVVSHPYSMGNGAAVKTGARVAQSARLVFMDADGQHDVADIERLLVRLDEGYDMAIGARSSNSQASLGRRLGNALYNRFASWMTDQSIPDLTSGFRAVKAERFREFLYLLPNRFSYPTTITMAFFRAGYPVAYVPITAHHRIGRSHIQPLRDAIRFLLIIFKVGTLYSPMKVFLPVSVFFFLLGTEHYIYTFFSQNRFTNMDLLLYTTSVIIFMIGLVSEQVTQLLYSQRPGHNQ
ncbi:dolichol-phosphate hexosyltransferase [Gammaproteobacteria bacterium]